MRLGGTVAGTWHTPEEWGRLLRQSRFKAVTCPVDSRAPRALAREYFDAARDAAALIAEVGVWRNPLSPDPQERAAAMAYAREQLAFAEEMGVPCCVNVSGARGGRWDGAYAGNYAPETEEMIVLSVREIIDAVQPRRAFYTLEPMPWMLPDGPDEYLRLIREVDRTQFAAHMDFVNMINSPRRFLFASAFIEECFRKLGPFVKSTHLKDSLMEAPFTSIFREVPPGQGALDLRAVLAAIDRHLPADTPVLLEHMRTFEEYAQAYDCVAQAAQEAGIPC